MSAIRVVRAGPDSRTAWDAFVVARHEGDVLQTWAWGEAMRGAGQPPSRILVRGEDGRVRGVAQALVRRSTLGRTILYAPHGPVWERDAEDAPELLAALVGGLRRLAKAERGIVVKLDPRADPGPDEDHGREVLARSLLGFPGVRPARHDLQARSTLLVDLLDGDTALMGTWDPKARNLVRRAAKEGVEVRIDRDGDPGAIEAFHGLLAATAERAAFRAHPAGFFRTLAAELGRDGWYLGLAYLGERPVAGMVAVRVGDRAYYLYGATDRDPVLRNANGGYATMARVMAALAADGVRTLDLWGVADEDDEGSEADWHGFSQFKRRFGGRPLRHPGTFDLVVDRFWYLVRDTRERLLSG